MNKGCILIRPKRAPLSCQSAGFSPGSHTYMHACVLPYTPTTHLEIQRRNAWSSNGRAGVLNTPPVVIPARCDRRAGVSRSTENSIEHPRDGEFTGPTAWPTCGGHEAGKESQLPVFGVWLSFLRRPLVQFHKCTEVAETRLWPRHPRSSVLNLGGYSVGLKAGWA